MRANAAICLFGCAALLVVVSVRLDDHGDKLRLQLIAGSTTHPSSAAVRSGATNPVENGDSPPSSAPDAVSSRELPLTFVATAGEARAWLRQRKPTRADAAATSVALVVPHAHPTVVMPSPRRATRDEGEVNQTEARWLFVAVNSTFVAPAGRVSPNDPSRVMFDFHENVTSLVIEIGTNNEPELTGSVMLNPGLALIAFEPQPDVFVAMKRRFPVPERLLALPIAVTPEAKRVPMYISAHQGCSSLLPMNARAERFTHNAQRRAVKRSQTVQLRTVEYCVRQASVISVPGLPLSTVLSWLPLATSPPTPLLPSAPLGEVSPNEPLSTARTVRRKHSLRVTLLVTDAQGLDTHVISTMTREQSMAVNYIQLECQDLQSPSSVLFLVHNAPNCATQRHCFEQRFPHRLVTCWDNAPKVRELNCLYALPSLLPDHALWPPPLSSGADAAPRQPPRRPSTEDDGVTLDGEEDDGAKPPSLPQPAAAARWNTTEAKQRRQIAHTAMFQYLTTRLPKGLKFFALRDIVYPPFRDWACPV